MRHVLLAGAVAAAALLFAGAVPRPAEALPASKLQVDRDGGVTLARRGGGHGRGGHHGFHRGGGRHFGRHTGRHHGGIGRRHSHGHHRHRGRGIRIYPRYYGYVPYYYDYYDYYDDDRCARLRRKALRTGNRYWWRRYERCLREYY